MGYYLQAFICQQSDASLLISHFDKAISVNLAQGLCLIPMTEELFDQMNNSTTSIAIESFMYLTSGIEANVLRLIADRKMAYVEADYFGGEGGQMAIVWSNNKRDKLLRFGQGRINDVLAEFGVVAKNGQDAFSTIGLGLHRHTRDWLESEEQ